MKILILPSTYITDYSNRNLRIYLTYFKNIATKFDLNFAAAKQFYYSTEHYHYSHIPLLIGHENTFIIGSYFNDYSTNLIPSDTRYPSLHNSPKATHLSFESAIDSITEYDAVLIGIRSGEKGIKLRELAKKKSVLVAYLDYTDHPEIYKTNEDNQKNIIFRGLKANIDFDIFFKHDVPLSFEQENIFSICPTPINPENYPKFEKKNFINKKFNISFLGRLHSELQNERSTIINSLEKEFKKTYFKKYGFNDINRQSLSEYATILNESKIIFSPSGKVWDSVRHAETALYQSVPLISQPYCKLASDLKINDENSIFYKTSLVGKNIQIDDINNLYEKIKYIIDNEKKFNELSLNWSKEILNTSTLLERAKYVVSKIKKHL